MIDGNAESVSITLTGSSLPFVLIGPAGKHRRVLVKSVEDTLDLVGLDGLPEDFQRDRPVGLDVFALNFGRKERGQRNIVRGRDSVAVGNGDKRTTFYSFAWRGLATTRDCEEISDQLNRISKDLEKALNDNRVDDVEFVLASIVLLCERINERRTGARVTIRIFFALSLVAYGVIGLYFLLKKI